MEGAFDRGTVLWFWYNAVLAGPAMALALVFTFKVLVRISWSGPIPMVVKILATLGTTAVVMVVLDRIGVRMSIRDPETFGYVSMLGAAVAILLGLFAPTLARVNRGTGSAPVGLDISTPAGGTMTDMASGGQTGALTAVVGAATGATQVARGEGGSMTMVAGGAGATLLAESPGPPAQLLARQGSEAGTSFLLTEGTATIGRSSDNTVVLQDPGVSRHHARITQEGPGYVLEDLDSSAGTMLDGAPVQRQKLYSGSVVRLGDTELVFQAPQPPPGEANTIMSSAAPTQVGVGGETMILGQERAAAWLLVRKGDQAGQSFGLQGETITIGRGSENTICLEDKAVSRHHVLIQKTQGHYLVYDAGSRGGTKLNDQLLAGASLRDGSRISLGTTELLFTRVQGGAPAASMANGQTMVMHKEARGVLMARSGPASGQSFPLGEEDLVIGREPGSGGAELKDSSVSRRHAVVRKTSDGYALYDLGSANGTNVDGVKLTGREIKNGDVIQLGATELQVVLTEPA